MSNPYRRDLTPTVVAPLPAEETCKHPWTAQNPHALTKLLQKFPPLPVGEARSGLEMLHSLDQ